MRRPKISTWLTPKNKTKIILNLECEIVQWDWSYDDWCPTLQPTPRIIAEGHAAPPATPKKRRHKRRLKGGMMRRH